MKILAINTTDNMLTAAVLDGDKTFSRLIDVGKSGHSPLLIPTVDAVLKESGIKTDELDAVAVVTGPGSFTGIRIGVSAATAISYASGAKRIAVNSFELLAYSRGRITAAVDAGHGNTYIAECENGKVLSTDFVESADKQRLDSTSLVWTVADNPAAVLAAVVRKKLAAGEYVDVFEPVYLRKSQAERNLK